MNRSKAQKRTFYRSSTRDFERIHYFLHNWRGPIELCMATQIHPWILISHFKIVGYRAVGSGARERNALAKSILELSGGGVRNGRTSLRLTVVVLLSKTTQSNAKSGEGEYCRVARSIASLARRALRSTIGSEEKVNCLILNI